MLISVITAFLLIILAEGTGQWISERWYIKIKGFTAPLGLAAMFTVLELLYLPKMVMHGDVEAVQGSTLLVLLIALFMTIRRYKEVWHALWRPRSIYILLASALLIIILYISGLHMPLLPDTAFWMNQAVLKTHYVSGSTLQGFDLFKGFFFWMFHGNRNMVSMFLALTVNAISVMLILDIIDSFQIGNPWFRFTLIFMMVFYSLFYSWKISAAYDNSIWRPVFIALILFSCYEWLRSEEESIKYLIIFFIGAGLFTNKGFYMISVELIYLIGVYLLHIRKVRVLFDLSTFLIPVIAYTSAWLCRYSVLAGEGLALIYFIFLFARYRKDVYRHMIRIEDFLMDHCWRIFYIGIPVIFLIGSFILRFFVPGYGIEYSHYIAYFSGKPIRSYLFLDHSVIDIILDVFRWGGLIVFLIRAHTTEEKLIRSIFLGMVVFFINPLCMGMLSEIVGLEGYACAFEIIFNPFTDIMIFYWIYRQFEWTVIGQWVLELVLVFATLFGHVCSYLHCPSGLYTDLIDQNAKTEEVEQP